MPVCADTSLVDTLYITVQVPQLTPVLESFSVVVYFQPLGGDSLGPFWHFKRGWENEFNLLIDFETRTRVEGELPWVVPPERMMSGEGSVSYDHRSGRGRLDLGFHVNKGAENSLLPQTTYTCARIRIRHSRSDLPGCSQPVCIEASDLELRFATGRRTRSGPGDHRFVSWGSPAGTSCVPRITGKIPSPWHPK
jgi:hypothetical protein